MPKKIPRIPEKLDRHLADASASQSTGLAQWLDAGGALITAEAVVALHGLLPGLHQKIRAVENPSRLRRRLDLLTTYFEETLHEPLDAKPARRDVTFALFYFLKGFDRIPDSVPEIGLLDDALIIEATLVKHVSALRDHWLKRGRTWPENP
jgi:uncharacterized membrane protein YkvA (DUF1232 family)